ncbi:MAG: 2OG-Fe(II) oxygenase [Bacilli bacterium]
MQFNDDLIKFQRDGFLVKDATIPQSLFADFDRQVNNSWQSGKNWITRIKGIGEAKSFPLQSGDKVKQIGALLDDYSKYDPKGFYYLFHSLQEEDDSSFLIKKIKAEMLAAWEDYILRLVSTPYTTHFSLTSYTSFCRLSPHTDYSTKNNPYRLALLLYFGNSQEDISTAPLYFSFREKKHCIEPQKNRSVLFIPTPETLHWIEQVPNDGTLSARLAFSGWLI